MRLGPIIAFKGATCFEFAVGRLWLTVPFWTYIKLGIRPRMGWDNSDL